MQREEGREEAPDWLGPLVGLLIVIVLVGLAVLLWLTIFSAGEHTDEEAARLLPAVVRSVILV